MFQDKRILNIELVLLIASSVAVYFLYKQMAYGNLSAFIACFLVSLFYIFIGFKYAFDAQHNEAKITGMLFGYAMGSACVGILARLLQLPMYNMLFYVSFLSVIIAVFFIQKFKQEDYLSMQNRLLAIAGLHILTFVLSRFML